MSYTDAELEAMMIDLESDLVERKESAQDDRKIRRNICAFANDLPANGRPGVLLVGVGDDGSCASLTVDDALLTALANVAGEGLILPLPSMTVQKRVLRGCEVAVVTVSPRSAVQSIRWMLCGSWRTTPSCIGATRARIRPCASIGMPTGWRSRVQAASTGA